MSSGSTGDHAVDDLDDLTLTVARIQLHDLEELTANRKGKSKTPTDGDVAQDSLACHLRQVIQGILDHRLASSMQRAVTTDARLIQHVMHQEQQAGEDHRAAVTLQRTGRLPHFAPALQPAQPASAPTQSAPPARHSPSTVKASAAPVGGILANF